MTANIPARGALLGYVTSIIMMTLGIVVLPVVTAPAATAATTCQTPASGGIYRTPGPNQVALTIDDGPSGNWTPQVLNILQSHGVHATFFVIGENVRANPGMIGQILAGGNLVGNHTETHATLTGMSAAGQGQQMDSDTQDIINAGGLAPCFFRAPGGGFDPNTLSQARQRGMSLVLWSNDTLDWAAPSYRDGNYQNSIVSRATRPLYTNPIILMHDGSPGNYRQNTVDSLARVIEFYQARGYTFTDPLGNAFMGDNPIGNVDVVVSPEPGMLSAAGWAFDPNDSAVTIQVHVYVNGVGYPFNTGAPRPDVQAAYPHFTVTNAGFGFTVPAPGGSDHVTIYAINAGPGSHTILWDGTVNVASPNPIGSMDLASSPGPGQLRVAGWAFDPDNPTNLTDIHVYVNGVGSAHSTGSYRPDVKNPYPQAGANTGYDITVDAPGGIDQVTVYAINQGPGNNVVLWDGNVDTGNPNPIGSEDVTTSPAAGQVRVAGWAFDPNVPTTSIQIHVYVNGVGYPFITDSSRPDVRAAYPQANGTTGYDRTVPAPSGNVHVTVFAINQGPGSHTVLWDGYVNVMTPSPIGSLDVVGSVGGGSVRVAGWAFDPTSPLTHIDVHIYANSVGTAIPTGDYRLDVQAAYPQTSAYQGFIATVPAPIGLDTVCAYGINIGPGDNALLGCKSVTVIN